MNDCNGNNVHGSVMAILEVMLSKWTDISWGCLFDDFDKGHTIFGQEHCF